MYEFRLVFINCRPVKMILQLAESKDEYPADNDKDKDSAQYPGEIAPLGMFMVFLRNKKPSQTMSC